MNSKLKKIFLLSIILCCAQSLFSQTSVTKYVRINSGVLREKASATSKKVCSVNYTESVTVLSENGKWSYVQRNDKSAQKGWISTDSLSKKKIVAGSKVNANANEIALAGKALNKSIEARMARDFNYNYKLVDQVEAIKITDAEILAFLKEGKLKTGN